MPSLRTHAFTPHWVQREAIRAYSLSLAEQAVLHSIIDRCDDRGNARASQRAIAEELSVARSTVQNAITRLLECHLIEKVWPAGHKSAAQYHIPDQMPLPPSTIPAPQVRDQSQVRVQRRA